MVIQQPLTIKWLIGDWPENPLHKQAVQMLEISVRFIRMLLPEATRVIAISNLHNKLMKKQVIQIASKNNCKLLFTLDHADQLPQILRDSERRNTWWKYIPLKANTGNNIILDNDFIIWKIPPQLQDWQCEGGLLAYGTESRNLEKPTDVNYITHNGTLASQDWVQKYAGTVALSGALNGIGYNVSELPIPLKTIDTWKVFPEDHAWWASNFALYNGNKSIIDWKLQLPVFNTASKYVQSHISPESYMDTFCGGHFAAHNSGECTYYTDYCHQVFDDYLTLKGF